MIERYDDDRGRPAYIFLVVLLFNFVYIIVKGRRK